ncbi:hypothetical protein CRENBAI_020585 [Crenichthys baileyi]|uniref:5-aminolevulinate synthase presequence domain-containing protein n=1 Tax=Crenichthys baileyi TaxID=28760 RepID=A0AAV9S3T6_9TELE
MPLPARRQHAGGSQGILHWEGELVQPNRKNQAVGSQFPLLAIEKVQNQNKFIREAWLELQEDVQEINTYHTDKETPL